MAQRKRCQKRVWNLRAKRHQDAPALNGAQKQRHLGEDASVSSLLWEVKTSLPQIITPQCSATSGAWHQDDERVRGKCVRGVHGVKGTSAITHISFFKKHKLQFIKTREQSGWVSLCESNTEDEKETKSDRKTGKIVLALISSCFFFFLSCRLKQSDGKALCANFLTG